MSLTASITYGPGLDAHVLAGRLVHFDVRGLDDQFAAARHGIPRIGREVHDDLLEVRRIRFHASDAGRGQQDQLDIVPQQAAQHRLHIGHHAVQIEHARLRRGAAAKGQQVARQRGGPLARVDDFVDEAAHRARRRELRSQQLGVSGDHRQDVIEIARDSARQPAHRVHLLRVRGLLLQLQALADVAQNQTAPCTSPESSRTGDALCSTGTSVPLRETSSVGSCMPMMTRSRKRPDNRILERLPAFLLQEFQHLGRGFAERVGARPAGQALGHRIEERDPAIRVANQHARRQCSTASRRKAAFLRATPPSSTSRASP